MRVALCGYGYYGTHIARMLVRHQVVAICESSRVAASKAMETFPNAQMTTDITQLNPDNLDIVWECTSVRQRRSIYQWAKENNIPIVLEKPLALKENGLHWFGSGKFTVDFREIYHPVLKMASRFLCSDDVQISSIHFIRGNTIAADKAIDPEYRKGVTGGSLLDKGIHDMANLFFCLAPADQFSVNKIRIHEGVFAANDLGSNRSAQERATEGFPCDLYSDIEFYYETPVHRFPVRLLSSWIGVDPKQARFSCPDIIQRAFRRKKVPKTYKAFLRDQWECKLLLVEFASSSRRGRLIGSTLHRQDCSPFILVQYDDGMRYILWDEMRNENDMNNYCDDVLRRACSATASHVNGIIDIHRAVFQLRQAAIQTLQ